MVVVAFELCSSEERVVEISEHITAVEGNAKLFAAAARQGGLDTEIPTCPGWDMRDLVRHLGEIHLWAAAHVAKPHFKPWVDDLSELTAHWPELGVFWPNDDDLVDWYLKTNANLVDALVSAPEDLDTFTFLVSSSPLAMWARRQAHEIAIHRFDAEHAVGIPTEYPAEFAADGIDELVAAFAIRKEEFPVDKPRTMQVHAENTGDDWMVTFAPDGITTTRDGGSADVTLTGTASDLYLALWNRLHDSSITVVGDDDLLAAWHGNHRVRWST